MKNAPIYGLTAFLFKFLIAFMNVSDPWLSVRTGTAESGLRHFKTNYDKAPTPSNTMELGVAYLWVQKYEMGWQLFRTSIEQFPRSLSSFYGMAGVAKWCLGDITEAVRQWRDGQKSRYSDTNGLGIHLPLLLLVASVMRPGVFEETSARRLLEEKAKDPRVKDWPGPIARWILREITEAEIRNQCSCNDARESRDRLWLVDFYKGVLSRRDGNSKQFKNAMRILADTTQPAWTDQDFFLARLWSEEFFLARHEAS